MAKCAVCGKAYTLVTLSATLIEEAIRFGNRI